jgi:hypothetical protein
MPLVVFREDGVEHSVMTPMRCWLIAVGVTKLTLRERLASPSLAPTPMSWYHQDTLKDQDRSLRNED